MGLILDSSVVIDAERRSETVAQFISRVIASTRDQHAALSSVGLTELVHGVFRAKTNEQGLRRQAFVEELLRDVTVYPYTQASAMIAGQIDGEQPAKGIKIPFADLLIGAMALSLSYSVLTANIRHFERIPGLSVVRL